MRRGWPPLSANLSEMTCLIKIMRFLGRLTSGCLDLDGCLTLHAVFMEFLTLNSSLGGCLSLNEFLGRRLTFV